MDTRIFVVTHKNVKLLPQEEGYELIQVGAMNKEPFCALTDCTGEHIADKNPTFCELTALYWIWKNVKCDIAGLMHYRRFLVSRFGRIMKLVFGFNTGYLSKEKIEKILEQNDIILVRSDKNKKTVREEYHQAHYKKDLDTVYDIICERYPEYSDTFNKVMDGKVFHYANIMVCNKALWDSYCDWLFDILFEAERRIDISSYDNVQKRIFGYLSERLLMVWVYQNKLKIYEADIINTEDPNAISWYFKQRKKSNGKN